MKNIPLSLYLLSRHPLFFCPVLTWIRLLFNSIFLHAWTPFTTHYLRALVNQASLHSRCVYAVLILKSVKDKDNCQLVREESRAPRDRSYINFYLSDGQVMCGEREEGVTS